MTKMAQYYGGQVNIEFGEFPDVDMPYSTLSVMPDSPNKWGEAEGVDFGNSDAGDNAEVYAGSIREAIRLRHEGYPLEAIPITLSERSMAFSNTGTHEVGHLLGLTKIGDVLDGINISGDHNRNPYTVVP